MLRVKRHQPAIEESVCNGVQRKLHEAIDAHFGAEAVVTGVGTKGLLGLGLAPSCGSLYPPPSVTGHTRLNLMRNVHKNKLRPKGTCQKAVTEQCLDKFVFA
ncbi:hypothetical protein STEG23_007779 [Scotinomys teguina]